MDTNRSGPDVANPLGLQGIEFIEYAAASAQAMDALLTGLGFRPVAAHRSRPVRLYRQGGMNVVVNASLDEAGAPPRLAAIGLRVHDARAAWQRVVDAGAWPVPALPEPMELHIPAIHGVGDSRLHFVDRWREFSIFDVDFVPLPGADPRPPAHAGLHWFGIVQYAGEDRCDDWTAFYRELFGFVPLPADVAFGVLPKGRILRSPCGGFHLQIVEPRGDATRELGGERFHRIALGAPDVLGAVRELTALGARFVESDLLRPGPAGALTRARPGEVPVELVRSSPPLECR